MSSGIKQVTQYIKETVIGTMPTGARQTIAFTDMSLDQTIDKTESASIVDTRLEQASMITKATYAGDLGVEAQYGAYDDFIAAAAYNAWVANSLTFGGTLKQTFSFIRGFTDISNYHTFNGVFVDTFELTVPESGLITFKFGLKGMKRTPSTTAPTGTATAASTNPKLSNVSVGDVLIDGNSVIGTACMSAVSFKWENGLTEQPCLGKGLEVGAILEMTAKGSGSFTLAWSGKSADYYEKQFANGTVSLSVPLTDSIGNKYVLTVPKAEIKVTMPAGKGSDTLQAQFEYKCIEQPPVLVRTPFVASP